MRAGISFPCLHSPLSLISVGAYRPLFPSSQSGFFFRRFSRRAGCNPATPIVAHEGSGGGNQARRVPGGRRASCYICNVFAFTIFQLVCILELLLLASTLVPSIFFSPFLPAFLFAMFKPPLVDAAFYVSPASWIITLAAQ